MPSITVIIAAYQARATLSAALASVAAQTRTPDQVVVVDDGSTDGTGEVASAWQGALPLTVMRKDCNEGIGAARRTAIELASGDLLALLDADDYWLPDHLEVVSAHWSEVGGIVAASGVRWSPATALSSRRWDVLVPVPAPDRQEREILSRNFVLSASTVLMERRAYEAVGGFSDLRCDEDWDLWIRMIRGGQRVNVPGTATVVLRNRPGSLSSEEAYLPWDVRLLEGLLSDVAPHERKVVARALDRRRARIGLVDGYEHARHGRMSRARRAWLLAALRDRSLKGGLAVQGSVTLRALLCIAAPGTVVAWRDRRSLEEARHG